MPLHACVWQSLPQSPHSLQPLPQPHSLPQALQGMSSSHNWQASAAGARQPGSGPAGAIGAAAASRPPQAVAYSDSMPMQAGVYNDYTLGAKPDDFHAEQHDAISRASSRDTKPQAFYASGSSIVGANSSQSPYSSASSAPFVSAPAPASSVHNFVPASHSMRGYMPPY